MTPSKDMTPPRSPSEGRQRSLKPSPEAATDASSPDFALRGDTDRAVQAGTDCRRHVPAGHFHLAPRSTRAANAFQVALPPAGSSVLCWVSFVCSWPGSSLSYPPRQACCWAALPAVSQPARFTPEGPFTQGSLAGAERLPSHVKSQLGASAAHVCTWEKPDTQSKRSREDTILAWVLLEGRAKWKRLEQSQPRRTQPGREFAVPVSHKAPGEGMQR